MLPGRNGDGGGICLGKAKLRQIRYPCSVFGQEASGIRWHWMFAPVTTCFVGSLLGSPIPSVPPTLRCRLGNGVPISISRRATEHPHLVRLDACTECNLTKAAQCGRVSMYRWSVHPCTLLLKNISPHSLPYVSTRSPSAHDGASSSSSTLAKHV